MSITEFIIIAFLSGAAGGLFAKILKMRNLPTKKDTERLLKATRELEQIARRR